MRTIGLVVVFLIGLTIGTYLSRIHRHRDKEPTPIFKAFNRINEIEGTNITVKNISIWFPQ